MNDTTDRGSPSNTGVALMGFAVGAVVGAGLALLLAPDSGKKTRERIGATAQDLKDRAGHTLEQVRDTMSDLGVDAQSAVKAGQEAFLHDRATRGSHPERRRTDPADHEPRTNAAKHST